MKMYIEVESRAKALDQCYCTSRPALESVSSFVDQMCRNCAVNDTQNLPHGLGVGGKQVSEGKGEADHPLAKRQIGKNFIREKGRGSSSLMGDTGIH